MLQYKLEPKGASLILKLEDPTKRGILYLSDLKNNADKATELLIKLHLRANGGRAGDTLSFQEILIPPNSKDLIRTLVETGRLTFQGKRLMVGQKETLYWKGEKRDAAIWLQAFIGLTPLEKIDYFIPGFALSGEQFIEVETAVDWRCIEPFKRGALILEGIYKRRFLDEEPKVIWKEVVVPLLELKPVLALTDPTGCFGNLRFDYGIGKVDFDDFNPQVAGRLRMKKEEGALEKDLIESGYKRKKIGNSNYFCSTVRETLKFLLEMGWTCLDMRGRKILLQSGVDVNISEEGDSIAVRGCVRFQDKSCSLLAAQKPRLFLELGDSVGLLESKDIPILEGDWSDEGVVIHRRRIGEVLPLLETANWEDSLKSAAASLAAKEQVEPVCLENFRGKLFPYQEKGVEWLTFLYKWQFGALLSDEMGLGKTVQVVAFFSHLRTNLPILIVAPTSLLFNWKREIEQFWIGAKVYVHSGPERLKTVAGQSIVLTSYALLRIDQELFSSTQFEVVALDESQAIKTATSQASEAACRLKAKFKIAITGTPVENRREELWAQFRFIMPELLGTKSEFAQLEAETLKRKMKPFVLRRLKADVQIDLPEKVDRPVWLALTEEGQTLYDKTIATYRNGLLKQAQIDRMEILEAILRIRQITCDPRLRGEDVKGAKAEWVLNFAQELVEAGKKGIIFSQFTSFLKLLQNDLNEIGITPLYLDGSTPVEERGEIVRRFQEENTPHLFLLSLKAGGVGLNLTAAEDLVLMDPWWNEAVERQAIDRAHRIGQKRTLFVHRLLTPDSIEEKMVQLKAHKTAISEELFTEETRGWSPEDLLQLFD